MSAIENQPKTLNFLSPVNFRFQIKKTPSTNFFVQRATVPGFSVDPTKGQPNPFVKIPVPGEHATFEPFSIEFKVDEKLQNYMELYTWVRQIGFPQDFKEYADLTKRNKVGEGLKSDMSLIIMDSDRNPKFNFIFINAFPYMLSGWEMDSTTNDIEYVMATCTFAYERFDISFF